jgi:hypothetical protein
MDTLPMLMEEFVANARLLSEENQGAEVRLFV